MALVNLTRLSMKSAILCEILQNDGRWPIHGHFRSAVLVSIKSLCATPERRCFEPDLSVAVVFRITRNIHPENHVHTGPGND